MVAGNEIGWDGNRLKKLCRKLESLGIRRIDDIAGMQDEIRLPCKVGNTLENLL